MRLFKEITINKKKRKINLRRKLIKERYWRRRKVINLCELNRQTIILNQIKTNSLRRLFIENVRISSIINFFINVYNIKKAMKLVNKTLIKEKSKFDIRY